MALGNMVIQLAEGRRLAFRGARDVHLECTEGMVWFTIEGQLDDFLLAQGERLHIASNGLALIQGLPFGSIQLIRKEPKSIHQENRFAWPSNLLRPYCCIAN